MSDLTPPAAILTAVFSPVPATPAQTPPATPAPTALSPSVPVNPTAPITASQAATMADWVRKDLASGKITQANANKIFNDLNVPLDQRVTPADTRTDEQRLIDEQFPAAKESEYLIRYYTPGQEPRVMPKELQQFDQSARTRLNQAEFPRELGNSLVTAIERVAQPTKHMDANRLEQYGCDEFEKLTRAYGGEDKLQEKLRAAAVMIDALDKKQPGLKNLLRSKGIGDNALVVAQIIGQSERWHARRKGR